jgi:hypothetical protein
MSKSKLIYGLYNDDEVLVKAAKNLVAKGVHVKDVYSPFPVHGIEKIIGMPWTRLAICCFIYGITGALLAVLGIRYFMVVDWPINIGGKPNFHYYENVLAFVPITFEFTVLLAAHGMALTYFIRNWTFPGVKARNPHPRTTDDHFALEIHPEYNHKFSVEQLKGMLQETGTVEVFEK